MSSAVTNLARDQNYRNTSLQPSLRSVRTILPRQYPFQTSPVRFYALGHNSLMPMEVGAVLLLLLLPSRHISLFKI
jgi:hypothetical protein